MSQPESEEQTPERKKGVSGAVVVVVVLLVVIAGTAAWFAMDHGRDVLSKSKGTVFAASFEKICLPNHGKETCRTVAGANHSRCLRESADQTDEGIQYDEKRYLTCMRAALDTYSADQ